MPTIIKGSISILSDAGLGMAMFSLGLFMALQPKIIACGNSVAAFSMAVRFLTGPAVIAVTSIAIGLRGVLLDVAIVQTHKKVMIDSLWKLYVADIEATLSRVCQMDNMVKREELRARAKGLKALGKIFERVKSSNGGESEVPMGGGVHKLNGNEQCNDGISSDSLPKYSGELPSHTTFPLQGYIWDARCVTHNHPVLYYSWSLRNFNGRRKQRAEQKKVE